MPTRSPVRKRVTRGRTLKDPQGGLTDAGRAWFHDKEGANLKPGVKGKADTPEKMRRKGSFLRRHFTHPRGPMVDAKGKPTRLALSARAWGEPVPRDTAGAKKLADKGARLLERYHAAKERSGPAAKRGGVRKTRTAVAAKRTGGKKTRTVAAARSVRAKKGTPSTSRKPATRRAKKKA
ncbi:DUF6321 domain-containing protein [Corallococcus sp. BB11-1]|uniref:DUF6321 domain-containing protein n=1 Tax=Corallococcus sp. BB11-1 TaxID=2996783 RepID=UPI002270460D|nr:DUF6321 domain-containing protein [Corallococcus sp. BB11-1]MCY1036011.1 DUF6321 domain-containing protein [Corallococcus sp. BB11-1]